MAGRIHTYTASYKKCSMKFPAQTTNLEVMDGLVTLAIPMRGGITSRLPTIIYILKEAVYNHIHAVTVKHTSFVC